MFGKWKENKKHVAVLVIFTVIFLLFSLNIYSRFIHSGVLKELNEDVTDATELLQTGDKVVQPLNPKQKRLCQVNLYFATYDNSRNGNGGLRIRLVDTGTKDVLAEDILPTEDMYDNQKYEFSFSKVDVSNRNVAVEVEALDIHEDATIALYLAEFDMKQEEKDLDEPIEYELKEPAELNGEKLSNPLRMDYRFLSFSYREMLIVLSLAVLYLFIMVMYYLIVIKQCGIHRVYLIAVVVLGILYILLFPEFTAPDERTHIMKAVELSNQLMGYDISPEHFELRQCEADLFGKDYRYIDVDWETYEYYYGNLFRGSNDGGLTAVRCETYKTPQYQYLLSGLGVTLGRILGLNALTTLAVGMVFNFIFFVVLTYFAVKWIPFGKVTTAITCLLPITLQQATSYSYDCIVIPLALLFTACLLRVLQDREVKNSTVLVLALTAVFFLPTKQLAYLPVALLLVYACFVKWKTDKKLVWKFVAILGFGLIFTVIMQSIVSMEKAAVATNDYSGPFIKWANQPGYSLRSLLASPVKSLDMVWNTLYEKATFCFDTTFGGKLSWMSTEISAIAVYTYFVASVLSSMPKKEEAGQLKPGTRICFFMVFFLCVMCIVGGMLLSWTPVSLDYIEGTQGRYFLPVILLGYFAFRGKTLIISEQLERTCLVAVLLMQPFTVAGILYSV